MPNTLTSPEINIYAKLLIFYVRDYDAIPKSFQKYTAQTGYSYCVQLRDAKVIMAEEGTISHLIKQNKIQTLYISPFKSDPIGTEQIRPFRSLYERLPAGWDADCCGAAVLDAYHNALLYHSNRFGKENQVAHNRDIVSISKDGWCPFYTYEEASQFIVEFIKNGFQATVSTDAYPVDPNLFQWLCNTIQRDIRVPTDLEQITELQAKDFSQGTPQFPDWLFPVPGEWRLLGNLPHLEKLEFPHVCIDNFSFLLKCKHLKYLDMSATNFFEGPYLELIESLETLILPQAEITDFLFLKKCKHLSILDLSKTNFTDCSLLLSLPALKVVMLPSRNNLSHCEAMELLTADIKISEPEAEITPPPAPYLSKKKLPLGENGFYAQIIVADGHIYQGKMITKEIIQSLVKNIKANKVSTITISADVDMESIIFTADIKDGWAALALQDFEYDVYYLPCNEKYSHTTEVAPPRIGGQSPVLKSEALEDLTQIAGCVRHYIKSGKLSSLVKWVQSD